MILYIVISFFTALLLWILFCPVTIFVNTDSNQYHLMLPGIFKAVVVPSSELFHVRGWIFFIPFKYHPFRGKKKKKKEKPERMPKKKRLRRIGGNVRLITDALGAFRIRKLRLDLDTDDFMLNAWLVPAFSMVNSRDIQMRVNFVGNSSLLLELRIHLGSLLWIFIRNRYRTFINL
jgi:hypothetical protein